MIISRNMLKSLGVRMLSCLTPVVVLNHSPVRASIQLNCTLHLSLAIEMLNDTPHSRLYLTVIIFYNHSPSASLLVVYQRLF